METPLGMPGIHNKEQIPPCLPLKTAGARHLEKVLAAESGKWKLIIQCL